MTDGIPKGVRGYTNLQTDNLLERKLLVFPSFRFPDACGD